MIGAAAAHYDVLDQLDKHLGVVWGALVALVIVVLLTPAVGGMARLLGAVDVPGGRRLNRSPIPRLGGLALFLGIFVPALAFLHLGHQTRGVLLGSAVAVTVGAIDDFRGLRWFEKLAGQVLAASIPVGFGVWVDRFTFPVIGIHALPAWVGMPLTVMWIVAIMNMVNFLDGMDGLAAGVAAIAGGTFCVIALSLGKPDAAVLSAIVLGASLGFLRHNFYPARIFMGDSGALLLGFVLATVVGAGAPEDGGDRRPVLPAHRARRPDRGHDVRRRAAAEARRARVRGRPGAPAPSLPAAWLLAAAGDDDDLGLVSIPRRGGARHALPADPRARQVARVAD